MIRRRRRFSAARADITRSSPSVCVCILKTRVSLGDVPGGDRGDPGCDRAISVHPDSGAALQTDSSLYLQSSLPGNKIMQEWEKTQLCKSLTPKLKLFWV